MEKLAQEQNEQNTQKQIPSKPSKQFKFNCKIVKQFAYCQEQNIRKYMEDRGFYWEDIYLSGKNKQALKLSVFAILDGHNGEKVVEFAKEELKNQIKEKFKEFDDSRLPFDTLFIQNLYFKIFTDINQKLKDAMPSEAEDQGTCVCVVMIFQKEGMFYIYSINIGDTRAVLSRNFEAKRLSYDHKAIDLKEQERCEKQYQGHIHGNRLDGNLSVTRALGDLNFSESGLIVEPFVSMEEINNKDKNEINFIIVSSDGIWDALSDQEAVEFYKARMFDQGKTDLMISEELIQEVMIKSHDNIALFMIRL